MKQLAQTRRGTRIFLHVMIAGSCLGTWLATASLADSGKTDKDRVFELTMRKRAKAGPNDTSFAVKEKPVRWQGSETAVIVCDVWNKHWCASATRRVNEMAGRMNQTIAAARRKGALIIHAPSGTLAFYDQTPQRKRARSAPMVKPPSPLQQWCSLDESKEAPLPIDDSDGGCDCQPKCRSYSAWTRQHPGITIADEDAISDDGQEIYNLLEQNGVKNVILTGVHTNMCVLGRPFGIRQLSNLGKNVVLTRDLTDTMYNPRMRPFVSHEKGTELVIEHVEKYWAPTVISDDILRTRAK